ncbi:MAG TPA: helix-turn-helix transcriptional regulator [Acidimicrobiales bacterium]|nr:helix-turn-helix transcriptional regulator [Acidimicrobiales bacterium]
MSVDEFSAGMRAQRLLSGCSTQTTLAKALGVSPHSIAAWEAGLATPQPELLAELDRQLGLAPGTLEALLAG